MAYQPQWLDRRNEILAIAAQVRTQQPAAWEALKHEGTTDRRYINFVSAACIAYGIPAGVNLKRGGPSQSIDALALPNDTGCKDSTGTYAGLEIIDIVGGAEGGPNSTPTLVWGDVTQATLNKGEIGGWVAGSTSGQPVPIPPVQTFPYPDEPTTGKAYQDRVKATYTEAKRAFPDPNDPDAFRHFMRYGYSCRSMPEPDAANKHIAELRHDLGLPA